MRFLVLMLKLLWDDRNHSIFWAFRYQLLLLLGGIVLLRFYS